MGGNAGGGGGGGGGVIGEAELDRIARLARLRIDPGERAEMLARLAALLEHAASLAELDLEGVEPLHHPHAPGEEPVARLDADEPRAGLGREVLGEMAPAWDGRFVKVPKVLGGGGEG